MSDGDTSQRAGRWTVLAVASIAFAARLAFQLLSGIDVAPQDDAVQYDTIGWSLAQGGEFATPDGLRSTRAPTYPALLAATYAVFGHSWVAARIVQALLGAVTCAVLVVLGGLLFDATIGVIAGLAYALFPYAIFWSSPLLSEPLCAFLCLAATCLLVRARDGGPGWTAAWSLACALATLTRPNAALIFVLGLIWLVAGRPRWHRRAAGACAIFLLVLIPWTIRNYRVHHRLVFVTTMGGRVLWEGNNPHIAADPALRGRSANAPDLPQAALVSGLDEAAADAAYFHMAVDWIRRNPGEYVSLMGRKAIRLWNLSPALDSALHRLVASASMAVLLAFFVAGLALAAWRRDTRILPVLIPIAGVLVTGVIYWADARIRAPADPEIVLVAATAAVGAWRGWRARLRAARV
jgi:4-amino-4-deoxy-L-arabinose transferase-like glycosyltransferase